MVIHGNPADVEAALGRPHHPPRSAVEALGEVHRKQQGASAGAAADGHSVT